MIPKAMLGPEVVALGVLSGLLVDHGQDVEIDTSWFADPVSSLRAIGARLGSLGDLLDALLGPGDALPVEGFALARWRALPNASDGAPSAVQIVAPPAGATTGEVGFGLRHTFGAPDEPSQITLSLYVPLIAFAPDRGAEPIIGGAAHPCRLAMRAMTKDGYHVGGVSFSALEIDGSVALSGDPPTWLVTFVDLRDAPATKPATIATLAALLDPTVVTWLLNVLTASGTWLDASFGQSELSLGAILQLAGFAEVDDDGAYQLTLDGFEQAGPEGFMLPLLFVVLDVLAGSAPAIAVMPFPGGGLYVTRESIKDGVDYGFRLELDLALTGSDSPSADPAPSGSRINASLVLGSWLAGESDADSWVARSLGADTSRALAAGLSVVVLHRASGGVLSFAPAVALTSIGFNISGIDGAPLVDRDGLRLGGVELRGSYDSRDASFGFAARLDGLGFPLGPAFGGTAGAQSGTNPVARNLLATASMGSRAGDRSPVNPAFSISAAYVRGGELAVQLYDAAGAPAPTVLLPVDRALGPIQVRKLGVGWRQDTSDEHADRLTFAIDGEVSVGGVSVDLIGLSVGVPVTALSEVERYAFDLDGLSLTIAEASFELVAALVKRPPDLRAQPPRTFTEYDGLALIRAGTFALAAIGSYAYLTPPRGSGFASLFVFGLLDADFGGPAFFFVTGLAAGFGYNRALTIPTQDAVATFPLVAAASDPTVLGATTAGDGTLALPDPATVLAKLDAFVSPERGAYWLSAGVRFISYDLINSTALLLVELGRELEVGLLGLSWISLPPPPAPGGTAPVQKFAYAELQLAVKLLPAEGMFSATAVLTPSSFVLDPGCKLTGGFAFFVWFGDNPHAGQFVLTLGGYHPAFTPPTWFPMVPRLGFDWPISGSVAVRGGAYFALTPSAVMAGGNLELTFSTGDLHAWFTAQMDVLVSWAPFHYSLTIDVRVGVSYRLHLLFVTTTLTVEIGAQVAIWGPRMGGEVRIEWYVISFSIGFGAGKGEPARALAWADTGGTGFAQTLLARAVPRHAANLTAAPPAPAGIVTIAANDGLLATFAADGRTVWVVSPSHFAFSVATAIPVTEIHLTTEDPGLPVRIIASQAIVQIRPMRATLSASVLTLAATGPLAQEVFALGTHLSFEPAYGPVPAAKWGAPLAPGAVPEPNELLSGRLLGLASLRAKDPVLTPSGEFALAIDMSTAYGYQIVDTGDTHHLPFDGSALVDVPPRAESNARAVIARTIASAPTVAARTAVFDALRAFGFDPVTDGRLDALANDPWAALNGIPLIAGSAAA